MKITVKPGKGGPAPYNIGVFKAASDNSFDEVLLALLHRLLFHGHADALMSALLKLRDDVNLPAKPTKEACAESGTDWDDWDEINALEDT